MSLYWAFKQNDNRCSVVYVKILSHWNEEWDTISKSVFNIFNIKVFLRSESPWKAFSVVFLYPVICLQIYQSNSFHFIFPNALWVIWFWRRLGNAIWIDMNSIDCKVLVTRKWEASHVNPHSECRQLSKNINDIIILKCLQHDSTNIRGTNIW